MTDVRWLYVDLNSYFASVEQQITPSLRGKPVAVVPMLADSTSCIAASYEAKAFGVKTGTKVRDARRMCPGLHFVEARHEHYVDYHNRIVEAVESCLPVSVVASIDEMGCRLRGSDQTLENARALAREVKKKLYAVGSQLSCSVGLAPNRYLAKVASDMQKPNGLTAITKKDLPAALLGLKLRDFPGIGEQMEKRLNQFRIRTTPELLALDEDQLRKIWGGVGGERMHRWLWGEDLELQFSKNRSIGHSHVLPPNLRNDSGAYSVGLKLLHKAAARLRSIQHWTRHLSVQVKFIGAERVEWEARMLECQDSLTLTEIFRELWQEYPKGAAPLQVSLVLGNLIADADRNFSFFENKGRVQLAHAVDAVNSRYGKQIVYLGGTHAVRKAAPTRIAFSSIPTFDFD